MDKHIQTGIIAAVSVSEYDNNIIKKHEFTNGPPIERSVENTHSD